MGVVCHLSVVAAGCGSGELRGETLALPSVDSPIEIPRHVMIPQGDDAATGRVRRLTPVAWRVVGTSHGNEVELRSGRGYCADRERPPKYERASVVYRGRSAYITAYVAARRMMGQGAICEGIGYSQFGVVKLTRPVATLRLFDGSREPPVLRWPAGRN